VAFRELYGAGEVIVPAITWSSDIAALIHAGMTPRFVDVDPRTFGVDWDDVGRKITPDTKAIFPTHCLGFNAGSFVVHLHDEQPIPVIEDCCESIGATQNGIKLGSRSLASNFSFYYGHHMTTIEGGMICTNDEAMYETCRVLRSHGMIREIANPDTRKAYEDASPGCWPDFTFEHFGFNVRSTEINAVIGRNQLKRLDASNGKRSYNLGLWLERLDPVRFRTDYRVEGSSNFALPLVLNEPRVELMTDVLDCLFENGVEFRRGTAGGGNQLRQPYLRRMFGSAYTQFPQAEHIHNFGLYVGNYPDLDHGMIAEICQKLNAL
jgi:CDP-6-deoxy-D-xylo-4-hexulose-3-dehydrase